MSRLKDLMIEIEQFVGDQLQHYTNKQVLAMVKDKYGSDWVKFADDILTEYKSEVAEIRAQKYGEAS